MRVRPASANRVLDVVEPSSGQRLAAPVHRNDLNYDAMKMMDGGDGRRIRARALSHDDPSLYDCKAKEKASRPNFGPYRRTSQRSWTDGRSNRLSPRWLSAFYGQRQRIRQRLA